MNDICIPWPGVWLNEIRVESDACIGKEGFGQQARTYPVTIVQARCNGSYEGAPWLCFPLHPHEVGDEGWWEWSGSDVECMQFWRTAVNDDWPIGCGESPGAAYDNLIAWACRRAGVARASLEAEPTWDRQVLRERFPLTIRRLSSEARYSCRSGTRFVTGGLRPIAIARVRVREDERHQL